MNVEHLRDLVAGQRKPCYMDRVPGWTNPAEDMAEKRAPMRDTWRPWAPRKLNENSRQTANGCFIQQCRPSFAGIFVYLFFLAKSPFSGPIWNHYVGPASTLLSSFRKNPRLFFVTGSAPWILLMKTRETEIPIS